MNRSQARRMRMSRQLLNRMRRQDHPFTPFIFPRGVPVMPRPQQQARLFTDVEAAPKLVTSTKLDAQLQEYLETCAKYDQLEAKKKAQGKALLDTWHKKHGKRITTEEFTSTQVDSHHASINRMKLLELGVKPTVIEQATVKTPYAYPKVTRKKEAVLADLAERHESKGA